MRLSVPQSALKSAVICCSAVCSLSAIKLFRVNSVKAVVGLAAVCSSWRTGESGERALLPFLWAMAAIKQIADVFTCSIVVLLK